MTDKRWAKIIVSLLVLAVISGVFWSWPDWGRRVNTEAGDESFYHRLAMGRVDFNEDTSQIPITPTYPLFIRVNYWLFGESNYDAVRIAQLFLFVGIIFLVFLIGKEIAGRKIGLATSFLALFYFPLATTVGKLNREIIFTFFIALLVYCLVRAQKTLSWKWFAGSGIACFSAFLVNGVVIFLPLALCLGFGLLYKETIWKKHKNKLAVGLGAIVIAGGMLFYLNPGPFRSVVYEAAGSLAGKADKIEEFRGLFLAHFVGQTAGYYFAEKISPEIKPRAMMDYTKTTKIIEARRAAGESYQEAAVGVFREYAPTLYRNPHKVLSLFALHFLQFNGPNFFNPLNFSIGPGNYLFSQGTHPDLPSWPKAAVVLCLRAVWLFFMSFVVYGFILALKRWRQPGFIWIVILTLYFNAAYAFIFGLSRYAIPIYPYYILLFVIGFSVFLEKRFNYRLLADLDS